MTIGSAEAGLWPALLGGRPGSVDVATDDFLSAATRLMPPSAIAAVVRARTNSAIDDAVREAMLLGRYRLTRQKQALAKIVAAGLRPVAMKGFAAAHLYWPDPAARIVGDLDLLLRRVDLDRAVALLSADGFRFGGVDRKPWGFLSDAGYVPFHSPDGECNIDLHFQPDSYPLHLGLDVEAVYAAARPLPGADPPVLAPSPEHMVLIGVSNLAKDKFGVDGGRKLIDLALLVAAEPALDWSEIRERAARARLGRALRVVLALGCSLGLPAGRLPRELIAAPRGLRGAVFRRLVQDWRSMSPMAPGLATLAAREWLLAAEPAVAFRLAMRRLHGVLRPDPGTPGTFRDTPPAH